MSETYKKRALDMKRAADTLEEGAETPKRVKEGPEPQQLVVGFPTIDSVEHKPNLIAYHAACRDGFGAAFAAWRRLGDSATYVKCAYGETPPDCTGKHVAVFDFSWPLEALRKVQNEAASFILFDHHKTAMEAVGGEPNCYFDMKKAGARLAWEFFFPGEPVPKLIEYVEDRDLWLWQLPDTKEFDVAQELVPNRFQAWEELLDPEAVQR